MCAAIEFGIQPELFKAADGTPLSPFHLAQTIPAMALAHLTVAGIAEFALTFGVIVFLQRANIPVLRINHPNVQVDGVLPDRRPLGWRWAVVALGVLVVLTPLGPPAPGVRQKHRFPEVPGAGVPFLFRDQPRDGDRCESQGGATVPQLQKSSTTAGGGAPGRGAFETALARADRLDGAGKNAEAADSYRRALALAPKGWDQIRQDRGIALFALYSSHDTEGCARAAFEAYPKVSASAWLGR